MSALAIRGLSYSRPAGRVLDGLDLDLQKGERVSILGPSGSGKTTLLRLIAGLETPEAGEIHLNDRLVSSAGRVLVPPHARSLGFVFQDAALWPHMRVIDHLHFARPQHKVEADRVGFDALLSLVDLEGMGERYPDQLSGGEARRVGLARAIAAEPDHLLMDEPLANLDHHLRSRMLETIDRAVEQLEASLVYVTHEPSEAISIATRSLEMVGGRLVQRDQNPPGPS